MGVQDDTMAMVVQKWGSTHGDEFNELGGRRPRGLVISTTGICLTSAGRVAVVMARQRQKQHIIVPCKARQGNRRPTLFSRQLRQQETCESVIR